MRTLFDAALSGLLMLVLIGAVVVVMQSELPQTALLSSPAVPAASQECSPDWDCTHWSACQKVDGSAGMQVRYCADAGCGGVRNESRYCELPLVKVPLPSETDPSMPDVQAPRWELFDMSCDEYYSSPTEQLAQIRASCVQLCEEEGGFPSWGCDEIIGRLDCRCT